MDYQEIKDLFYNLDYLELPSCQVYFTKWTSAQTEIVEELLEAFNTLKYEMAAEEDTEDMLGEFTRQLFNCDGGWTYQG